MSSVILKFLHLCDAATVDSSGKLNILGVFGKVYLPIVPSISPRITVVMSIELGSIDEKQHSITITIEGPLKEELKITPALKLDFTIPKPQSDSLKPEMNLIFEIDNLGVINYGSHKILIKMDNSLIGEGKFEVERRQG